MSYDDTEELKKELAAKLHVTDNRAITTKETDTINSEIMRLRENIEGAELRIKWLVQELIKMQREKKQLNLEIEETKERIQFLKSILKGARKK